MSQFLDNLAKFFKTQSYEIIRVSEIHNGGEVETLECVPTNRCQNVYSVAKTFTMTAIGLLYDKGLLRTDDKICDILSDELPENGMDERWRSSTIDMALRHRLGLPAGFLDIDVYKSSDFTDDFLRYLLTYPLVYTPDSASAYTDGAYYLLARIAEKLAGMSLDDFLWRELLLKLDFQELAWSHCPRGHVIGATGLYIHSSDMAKLGLVYLTGGLYHGERVLSSDWVKLALDRCYALDWDARHATYCKGGMYGQKLVVAPAQQRVLAIQSYNGDIDAVTDWLREYGERE